MATILLTQKLDALTRLERVTIALSNIRTAPTLQGFDFGERKGFASGHGLLRQPVRLPQLFTRVTKQLLDRAKFAFGAFYGF